MSTEEGLKVSLHPLPILNISDHYTRLSLQYNNPNVRVVGGLLGTQLGRDIDIVNSFELVVDDDGALDHAYFVTRRDQFKQVFPTFDFLGWYSVGEAPTAAETALHKQFFEYNESPLFLQLSPSRPSTSTSKDLPLAVYESLVEIVAGEPQPVFVPVAYEIETGEAERVAVDEASRVEDHAGGKGGAAGSSLIATLSTQRNALSMLSSRVSVITQYLAAVGAGKAKKDDETLRQISALVSGLKGQEMGGEGAELEGEFMTEYNDALLTTYLSSLTKQLLTVNELLDKQLLVVSSTPSGGGPGSGGGSGSKGASGPSRRSKMAGSRGGGDWA
ncbi:hypothetical protein JCM5296_003254 [Sporobolomyces johnsonii]